MKRTMFIIVVFSFVIGLCSCGGADNPAQAVNSFYDSVKEGNYPEARGLLTRDANSIYTDMDLDSFRSFLNEDNSGMVQTYPDKLTIAGNLATEPIIRTYSTDHSATLDISLVKSFGKWKITDISRYETRLRVESSLFCSDFKAEPGSES